MRPDGHLGTIPVVSLGLYRLRPSPKLFDSIAADFSDFTTVRIGYDKARHGIVVSFNIKVTPSHNTDVAGCGFAGHPYGLWETLNYSFWLELDYRTFDEMPCGLTKPPGASRNQCRYRILKAYYVLKLPGKQVRLVAWLLPPMYLLSLPVPWTAFAYVLSRPGAWCIYQAP